MPLLIVQLAILVAIAFVVGCLLGRFVRRKGASVPDRERTIIAAAHATLPVDQTEVAKQTEIPEKVAQPGRRHSRAGQRSLQWKPCRTWNSLGTGLRRRKSRMLIRNRNRIRDVLSFWMQRTMESRMISRPSRVSAGQFRGCSMGLVCFTTTRLPAGTITNQPGSNEV